MINGIFEVHFRSSMPDNGSGLIVIKDGSVNGGDEHFLYRGTLSGEPSSITAKINVSQWKSGNTSIIGAPNFDVEFKGSLSDSGLQLSGSVHGQTITVTGRRVADAA